MPPGLLDWCIEEGHWEGDTVVESELGKSCYSLSAGEKDETYLALRIPAKTSEAVMGAMNALHNEYGDHFAKVFKTITVDNGSEFADFAQVAAWGSGSPPHTLLGTSAK